MSTVRLFWYWAVLGLAVVSGCSSGEPPAVTDSDVAPKKSPEFGKYREACAPVGSTNTGRYDPAARPAMLYWPAPFATAYSLLTKCCLICGNQWRARLCMCLRLPHGWRVSR